MSAHARTATTGTNWFDPKHDAAGNMTEMPRPGDPANGLEATYDAWNRLVKLVDKSTSKTIAEYEYDGLNRRIVKDVDTDDDGTPDEKQHFYYNESWQVLEVRKDASTDPYKQYVWHTYHIDALAYRYHDLNEDGDMDDALEFWHYTHDANMNVTALIADGTGNVIERYRYNAYGEPIFLDGNWNFISGSTYDNEVLFAGYRYDVESGLYHVRNRMLHPELGRFLQRDPLNQNDAGGGYQDGLSLYQYVRSNSINNIDPTGEITLKNCLDACNSSCKETAVAKICRRLRSRRARAICWTAVYGSVAFCTGICYFLF